tara:strand:+ start:315 stop:911 length:597 start_codon:yes stop_codon:yes gene_type:complete
VLKHYSQNKIIAGCDEAGRGCLAGPVVAAAVILPKSFSNIILNDSKLLSKKKRDLLRKIIEREAISWAVGIVDNKKIDQINILNASILAMHRAIKKLTKKADFLIIDGISFKNFKGINHKCIIKGDGKYLSIAAASIIAKTHRDEIMQRYHKNFSNYKWNTNNGYPTKEHRDGIKKYGITKYHRKSFQLLERQTNLDI